MSRSILRFGRLVPLTVTIAACVFTQCVCSDDAGNPVGPGDQPIIIDPTGKSVDQLLKEGHAGLKRSQYDTAAAYYEAAYQKDTGSAKAIAYSTLAKIASISVDPNVVNLIKNRIGFTRYPNRMNALLSKDWMENYKEEYERFDWGYQYCAGSDCEIVEFPDGGSYCQGQDCKYANWYDKYEVNSGDYPGVIKEGYYYETRTGYTFVSSEPRYETRIKWSYYDENIEQSVYWRDEWDVSNYGLPGVGYYYQGYDDEIGQWGYTLVSSEPIYEEVIQSWYCDRNCAQWFDSDQAASGNYPGVTYAGYYYDNYAYTFVTNVKQHYFREEYDNYLPGLIAPEWVKGKGGSNSMYNSSLLGTAHSIETYPLLVFANLLEKNTTGLNGLLDETISAVFGAAFNEACARAAKLKNKSAVKLDNEFIDALNLQEFADEFDEIGWAEVNALTSLMTGIKASLEWVASYNWDTDLSFLKFAWANDGDALFTDLKAKINAMNVNALPFKNSFLEPRQGKMAAAKADFVKAITGLRDSYTAIKENPLYPPAVRDPYQTVNEGVNLLIAAINGGTVFYIPDDPTAGSWPVSGKNGIDMGKFFTEGYFSLPNLFYTKPAPNKAPIFYAADGTELTTANYAAKIDADGYANLKFKASRVTSVIVGFEGGGDDVMLDIPAKFAKLLFEKYNAMPLSKAPAAPLAKASARK